MSNVDHPNHYNQLKGVECIEIIEQLNLGFNLGNTVKYIWRCEEKGKKLEDLKKAAWYLQREILKLEPIKIDDDVAEETDPPCAKVCDCNYS